MTKEEKQLLLMDLCGRLPYKVKVRISRDWFEDEREPYDTTFTSDLFHILNMQSVSISPYLHPLSSMTDEEKKELKISIEEDLSEQGKHIKQGHGLSRDGLYLFPAKRQYDWLNEHHFDYRGLIEKGLAIEAPEGIYEF